MVPNPYQQYQKNKIETADPKQLIFMLYDGALKHLKKGRLCLEKKDWEGTNNNLGKVQDIISELMGSLDLEAGELAENLFRLYEFMHYRLVQANIEKNLSYIDEVDGLLTSLRQTWQEALQGQESLPGSGGNDRSRVNVSG